MKICIDGHKFDTEKARLHIELSRLDANCNRQVGDLYLSSKGVWYSYSPSQWANGHTWAVHTDAGEVLELYQDYVTDEEKDEIASLGQVVFE